MPLTKALDLGPWVLDCGCSLILVIRMVLMQRTHFIVVVMMTIEVSLFHVKHYINNVGLHTNKLHVLRVTNWLEINNLSKHFYCTNDIQNKLE